MPLSVDELLAAYKQHATLHASTGYGDPSAVRAGNTAAEAMVAVARQLAAMSPPAVISFASLLDCEGATADWVAHHLLEHFEPNDAVTSRALAVIERAASSGGANALGSRMWLDDWHERHRRTSR